MQLTKLFMHAALHTCAFTLAATLVSTLPSSAISFTGLQDLQKQLCKALLQH
jgi:hypothetical protein